MIQRLWASLNYRYCMANAYLASQRGENVLAGEWLTRAGEWELAYWQAGRGLR